MAIRGDLQEMPLTTLISINCNERNQSRLRLWHGDAEGVIYFEGGQIAHAASGDVEGEEAVYRMLAWEDGTFELEGEVPPPARTVHTPWSELLLDAVQLLDEQKAQAWVEGEMEAVAGMGADGEADEGMGAMVEEATEEAEPLLEERTAPEEVNKMVVRKRRGELLAEALSDLLANSTDIEGAAIVGIDGLVLSANVPVGNLDEMLVGATAAAISGLSKRSVQQLKRGDFLETLIRGTKGYIIVSFVDPRTVFIGLCPQNVNLGMVFTETREIVEDLAAIMAG